MRDFLLKNPQILNKKLVEDIFWKASLQSGKVASARVTFGSLCTYFEKICFNVA